MNFTLAEHNMAVAVSYFAMTEFHTALLQSFGFLIFFLFGSTLTITDIYFAALSESLERSVALH